jgi:hypothetical protein
VGVIGVDAAVDHRDADPVAGVISEVHGHVERTETVKTVKTKTTGTEKAEEAGTEKTE